MLHLSPHYIVSNGIIMGQLIPIKEQILKKEHKWMQLWTVFLTLEASCYHTSKYATIIKDMESQPVTFDGQAP